MDYLEALGMLLLLAGLFVAISWFFRQKRGYLMLPFLTADSKEFNGQAVSEELAAELQRIDTAQRDLRQLYLRYVLGVDDSTGSSRRPRIARSDRELRAAERSMQELLAAKRSKPARKSEPRTSHVSEISTARVGPQASLGDIATFKVGNNSFSLGQFFSDMKTFWSATDPIGVFSGSIRRHGADILVVVSFNGDEGRPSLWSAVRKMETERTCCEFSSLLRELAFSLYLDIEENPPCTTPEALREYTETILQLKVYFETRDDERTSKALARAVYSFKKALRAEAFGQRMSPLLPILLARTCLVRQQMGLAEELSGIAIDMLPGPSQESESETAAAWCLRGVLYHTLGMFLSAEQNFRLALSNDPRFEQAWRELALLLLDSGRRRHAVKAIGQLSNCMHERLKRMSRKNRKLEEDKRKNKGLRKEIILADLFQEFADIVQDPRLRFGLLRQARAQCWAAARKWPSNTSTFIRLGGLLADHGKMEEALKIYDAARKREPKLFELYNDSGIVYEALKRPAQAAECYRKAITLGPRSGVPHVNLGRIYLDKNNFPVARAEFLKAIAAEPQLAVAYSNLGFALYGMKRYDEAREALQLGLRPDQFGHVMFESDIHNFLGDIYLRKGETETAIAEFRRAVQLNPDWYEPHRLLGYAYRETGDPNAALEEFKIAQKLDPNASDAFHGAGGVLRQMTRLNEAAEEYKQAIKLNGGDAYAHVALSTCYEGLGQAELAAEYRKTALDLGDKQIESKYDRACFWALAGNRKQAMQLLAEALGSGTTTQKQAANDIDLASLRGDTEFAELVLEPHGSADSTFVGAEHRQTTEGTERNSHDAPGPGKKLD
jgi:tetratricopeptide (TPR) repeat protein